MDDLIRRSDALKELWYPFDFTRTEIDINIKHIPAVDAVEIVRCRECKKWKESYTLDNGQVFGICIRCCGCTTEDTFFCKDGDRKEVVNNETN